MIGSMRFGFQPTAVQGLASACQLLASQTPASFGSLVFGSRVVGSLSRGFGHAARWFSGFGREICFLHFVKSACAGDRLDRLEETKEIQIGSIS